MRSAVQEVDSKADQHPDKSCKLRDGVQCHNHAAADDDAENRDQWYKRRTKWPRHIGVALSHNPYRNADQHEREQRADRCKITSHAAWNEGGKESDEEEENPVGLVRRAELGVQIAEELLK